MINFIQIVFVIVVFFLILMTVYNWKYNKKVIYLAFFFIIYLFEHLMIGYNIYGTNPTLFAVLFYNFSALYLLKGPLLLFFVRDIFNSNNTKYKWDILHFFPFFFKLLDSVKYIFSSFEYKKQASQIVLDDFMNLQIVKVFSFYPVSWDVIFRNTIFGVYLVAIFVLIYKNYTKTNQLSNSSMKVFSNVKNWLYTLISYFFAICILNLLTNFLFYINIFPNYGREAILHFYTIGFIAYLLIPFLFVTFPKVVYGFTFSSLLNVQFEKSKINSDEDVIVLTDNVPQIEVDEKYESIFNSVIEIMNEQKPYLDINFQMNDLSQLTNIPKHQIQFCLNSYKKMSFSDFKNEFRINYAIDLLKNGKNLSLEGIGRECGFASNSNFYSCFKIMTGKTPLQKLYELNRAKN